MKLIKEQKGQALVEFALVIPILLLIIMAIIEFGIMFNSYLVLTNASREGARLASVGGSDFEIEERIKLVAGTLNEDNLIVIILPNEFNRARGEMVEISLKYNYQMITPIIANILSPFIDLNSSTYMRIE